MSVPAASVTQTTPVRASNNPYVGPRPYRTEEAAFFFGREREAQELLARVLAERLVLFYAQSGAGKSSLINTRLIPLLEAEGFFVLPVARVGGEVSPTISAIDNIFVFNVMLSLEERGYDPQALASLTLPHFLAHLSVDEKEGYYYDATASSATLDLAVADAAQELVEPPHLLILDQFEEIITAHPTHWTQRRAFFEQLAQAMHGDPLLWVLMVVREDYVAALEPYAPLLPNKLRARFYMERMTQPQALAAIQKPAEKAGRPFAPGVAEQLVDNLRQIRMAGQTTLSMKAEVARDEPGTLPLGQYLEPVQLQVVCYQLWEKLATAPDGATQAAISFADLQQAGDVDTALTDFYEAALTAALAIRSIDLTERRLRTWFDRTLITEASTRGTVYRGATETAGVPNDVVKVLEEHHLLRTENRAGGYWVELIHDRFIEPIQSANRRWLEAQSPLLRAARAWIAENHSPKLLYSGAPLRAAQAQLADDPDSFTDEEKAFVQASLQAEAVRARRRQRLTTVGVVLLVMVLVGLTGWALWSANNEIKARQSADIERAAAHTAEANAVIAQQAAESDRKAALRAEAAANTAKDEAIVAEATAETARAQADRLKEEIRADQVAQKAQLAYVDPSLDLYPQRALLLAVAAAQIVTPIIPSAQQALYDLLERTGGMPLVGHEGSVNAVAFAPDGQTLASASADNTVRLWNLQQPTAQPIILHDHEGDVLSVAFAPDGQTLASAGADSTIRLWNLQQPTAQPIILRGHEGYILSVAFAPDGQTLASAGADNTVRLWNLQQPTAQPIILRGHEGWVTAVVFASDGQTLASAGADNTVRLWNLQQPTAQPIILRGHEGDVVSVAFAPDGQTLASAGADNTIRLWNLQQSTAQPIILRGHEDGVFSVAFAPDGQTLASAGADNTVRLWNLQQPTAQPIILRGHEGSVWSVAFAPDGQTLASAGADNTVRLWNLQQPTAQPIILRGHEDDVFSVAFAPDGQTLASASVDDTVRLWNLQQPTAQPIILRGHEGSVWSVAFAPDGQTLASAGADDTVRLWNLQQPTAQPIILRGHKEDIVSVAFAPDGQTLASAGVDNTIRLWNLQQPTAQPIILRGHEDYIWSVAFAPDGQTLASASVDDTVRLWNLQQPTAQPIILRGHEGSVWSVAFAPDGQTLASAGADDTVRLWNLQQPTAQPIVLHDHEGDVMSVAFAPDGQTLASAGADDTVRLWNLQQPTAQPIILRGHEGSVWSVAFAPDGQTLASGSVDNAIHLWNFKQHLLELACSKAGRNLTVDEWRQYFPTERVTLLCPDWPLHPSYLTEADNLANSGNITDAMTAYQTVHQIDAKLVPQREVNRHYAVFLWKKANELAATGNLTDAITIYEQVVIHDPTWPISSTLAAHRRYATTIIAQADALAASGNITDALVVYQQALTLDPLLTVMPLQRANSLYALTVVKEADQLVAGGNITDAFATYKEAHILNAEVEINGQPLADIAAAVARRGEITTAVAIYEQVLALDPSLTITPTVEAKRQYALTVVKKADDLAVSGNITDAVATYEQALTLDPSLTITPTVEANHRYAAALVPQANNLAASGNITDAVATYKQALVFDDEVEISGQPLADAADLIAQRGEITAAVAIYEQALIFDPSLLITPTVKANQQYVTALVFQANDLAVSGNITNAITIYQQVVRLDPMLDPVRLLLDDAVQVARSKDITAVISFYEQALRLDPTLDIDSKTEAERVVAATVQTLVVEAQSGAALSLVGDPEKPIALLEQALFLNPDHIEARRLAVSLLTLHGETLWQAGTTEKALTAFARARELDPTVPLRPEIEALLREPATPSPTPTLSATAPPSPLATPTPVAPSPLATPTATRRPVR